MKRIQILGTGCPKCKKLEELTRQAADELNLNYNIEKVTNINDILAFGIMMTPGLVVDGEVKSSGKLLTKDEIKSLLI